MPRQWAAGRFAQRQPVQGQPAPTPSSLFSEEVVVVHLRNPNMSDACRLCLYVLALAWGLLLLGAVTAHAQSGQALGAQSVRSALLCPGDPQEGRARKTFLKGDVRACRQTPVHPSALAATSPAAPSKAGAARRADGMKWLREARALASENLHRARAARISAADNLASVRAAGATGKSHLAAAVAMNGNDSSPEGTATAKAAAAARHHSAGILRKALDLNVEAASNLQDALLRNRQAAEALQRANVSVLHALRANNAGVKRTTHWVTSANADIARAVTVLQAENARVAARIQSSVASRAKGDAATGAPGSAGRGGLPATTSNRESRPSSNGQKRRIPEAPNMPSWVPTVAGGVFSKHVESQTYRGVHTVKEVHARQLAQHSGRSLVARAQRNIVEYRETAAGILRKAPHRTPAFKLSSKLVGRSSGVLGFAVGAASQLSADRDAHRSTAATLGRAALRGGVDAAAATVGATAGTLACAATGVGVVFTPVCAGLGSVAGSYLADVGMDWALNGKPGVVQGAENVTRSAVNLGKSSWHKIFG